MAEFPKLVTAKDGYGFWNVDVDGVYRSYHSNGTVLDAARLTEDQINTYLSAINGVLSETEFAEKQALFAGVSGLTVPEAQLLNPPEAVKPHDLLDQIAEEDEIVKRNGGGLLAERQTINCPVTGLYCLGAPRNCNVRGCVCNSVICITRGT